MDKLTPTGINKKLGIITFHRAYNYGSALQAYALNQYLRECGFMVETIDFRTAKQEKLYKIFEPNKSIMSIARNIYSLIEIKNVLLHKHRFNNFIKNYIPLSNKVCNNTKDLQNLKYDYYICGSDQIWNPRCEDFDIAYVLSFLQDKNQGIAYAPSIGVTDLTDIEKNMLKKYIMGMKKISIREKSGQELLKTVGVSTEVVLDPVFLLDKSEWKKLLLPIKEKKPYIFCYFIGDVEGMRAFAVNMGKKLKLPLIVVYQNLRDLKYKCRKRYDAGPQEWLSLLENAEYVCTNSFHAVSFALIFEKKFWAFIDIKKSSSASRITDLLEKVGLKERIINPQENVDSFDYKREIKFELINKILHKEINNSKQFLADGLYD